MESQQIFWEKLKVKYEEKNQSLQQREQELKLKLEAMDAIIGGCNHRKDSGNLYPTNVPISAVSPISYIPSNTPQNLVQQNTENRKKCTCKNCASKKCPWKSPNSAERPSSTQQKIQGQNDRPVSKQISPRPDLCKREKLVTNKNENCRCDPCETDNDEDQGIITLQKVQQCDVMSKSSVNGSNCNCDICVNYNVSSAGGKEEYTCGHINTANSIISTTHSTPTTNVLSSAFAKLCSPSKLSLKSADLTYIKNIHDLATEQKDLLKQVNALEQKEKIYDNLFNEYKNANLASKSKNTCNNTLASSDSDQKSTAQLRLENFLLKNELKDMRLEVRQHLERMEGPMQFKIESERYKCVQLEQKLEETAKELANMQQLYEKEINSLKTQLCDTTTNLYNLNVMNDQMMQELQRYQEKSVKLQDDLICKKLNEAETIKNLQATFGGQTAVKDECELHNIARELSKVLRDCEPCGDCINLPEDLTSAARLLKSLTDMVDLKLNRNGDQPTTAQDAVTEDVATRDNIQEVTTEVPSQIDEKSSKVSKTSSSKQHSLVGEPQIEEKSSKTSKTSSNEAEITDDQAT